MMKMQGKCLITPAQVMCFSLVALGLCFFLMIADAKAPTEAEMPVMESTMGPALQVIESGAKIAAGCEITQTMGFSRCGHSVTRRIQAPENMVGADFAITQDYYDLWQVESFSAERITMRREISLFCPMHQVLTVNESGEVVLSQNQYGDGMAVLRTYPAHLSEFDEEIQNALILGLGFESEDAAVEWLGAH